MGNITIDAAQLQTLLDTVKSQNEALERLQRSESERIREDAARQESRQRQRSLSIAADSDERNRGRAFQSEWDAAYENLGRIAPAQREGETSESTAFVSRQASRLARPIIATWILSPLYFVSQPLSAKLS